jgi:5-methyltetrahydrofolate--homocysteine methyltransferase
MPIEWSSYTPPAPSFTGVRHFLDYDLGEIAKMIDWGPFFMAWEMPGRFPAVLSDERFGAEATKLYNDARALLQRIVDEKWLTANAAVGFWPARADGDDVLIAVDGSEQRLCHLRQQIKKAADQPQFCLADFVSPLGGDHIGGFEVTTGIGIEKWIEYFERQNDDYNSILLKALADRLAEAFAELMHQRVRRELWGYAADEQLTPEDVVAERYQGIRPAPGYPACPDHTEKWKLFNLLDPTGKTGISLTESLAMYPASSVSGWYFSHPQSIYFGVGKIDKDQVEQYAVRKGMSVEEVEKWLRPNLDYDI